MLKYALFTLLLISLCKKSRLISNESFIRGVEDLPAVEGQVSEEGDSIEVDGYSGRYEVTGWPEEGFNRSRFVSLSFLEIGVESIKYTISQDCEQVSSWMIHSSLQKNYF